MAGEVREREGVARGEADMREPGSPGGTTLVLDLLVLVPYSQPCHLLSLDSLE